MKERRGLFTVGAAAELAGGRILAGAPGTERAWIGGVTVDSRTVAGGDLFVALPGERTDGHVFAQAACADGAVAVMANQPLDVACPLILVRDTGKALLDLAAGYRRRFPVRVVGITGSVGKTTTKDLCAQVLGEGFRVLKNRGNYNSQIGLPLTMFSLDDSHQMAVLEMGMRGKGEIRDLALAARPEVGVITNVGESHLGLLGSREAIAAAKGELLEQLPQAGLAVLNGDDPYLRAMATRTPCPVILFGFDEGSEVRAETLHFQGVAGTLFRLVTPGGAVEVKIKAIGRVGVENALAAAAVGHHFGLSPTQIAAGLAAFAPSGMRGEVVQLGEILLVDDCYNASPRSMRAALESLSFLGRNGLPERRRVAVLGDMLELGSLGPEYHWSVGDKAAAHCDLLLVLGQEARRIGEGALAAGMEKSLVFFCADLEEVTTRVRAQVRSGDVVLVKGSRALGMEKVSQAIREDWDAQGSSQ